MTRETLDSFDKSSIFDVKARFSAKYGRVIVTKESHRGGYLVRFFWGKEIQCDPNLTRRTKLYRHALRIAEELAKDHD